MKEMIRYLTIIITVLLFASTVYGQDVKLVMSAPNAVENGKQFRLSFSVNKRAKNLKLPPGLTDNFEILMGPSTSQSFNSSFINGKTTTVVTYSYTYILRSKKVGRFELRPASIEAGGNIIESNPLTIQVVKNQSQPTQNQPQSQGSNGSSTGAAQNIKLDRDNLFVRVELSKRNVYKGEQIISTVKLYVNPNIQIGGFDEVNLPTYEGFFSQDIDIPQQINLSREVYNDKIYQVGVLKKTILFPQQTGNITIKPFNISLLIRQPLKPRSFFDDFFNSYRTVKAAITSLPVNINVKDLPPAPATFTGGVGKFNVSSEISSEEVTTNDAVTLKINISGNGNLRLVRNPELKLPSDFEVYDPQSTENVRARASGMSGTKTVEYLFQPRFEGNYTIPAVKFTFFNPATRSYETKSTTPYELRVKKGDGDQSATVMSSMRKENVQLLGKDVRFIKQGKILLKQKGHTFFGSLLFYFMYILSALAFIILFFVYRRKVKENANIALQRNKKANRVAKKRLKAAAVFMKQNNNEAFHESILKAFWGYLSDKLGIPVAELNRDSAVAALQNKKVEEMVINDFVSVVEQCEFARYAPSGGSEARHELYKKAETTMGRIEKQIKR
ncbi:MAG: hypothetical protein CSA36_03340 [Draconibacterium sp.]|nr:MAG: hypothetical protein CSA36_03340 [Draconibacterium sp.]